MGISSWKQFSPLLISPLIALAVCFGLKNLNAVNNRIFPNHPIKEISNFEMHCQEIFQIVAAKMSLKINESIPKPIILTDKQLSPQKFSRYLDRNLAIVCPYYFHKQNTILIPVDCKLDSLVHELVHYFQVMYRSENLDLECGPCIENLEMEAVAIQRWFKAKCLESHIFDCGFAGKIAHPVFAIP